METRYLDKISDKRTIAQKFGDKGAQEKKDSIEKSSNLKKGEKQTNGIWDDNDDENEEKTIKTIKSNIGKSDIIFSDSNTSYEKKETNEDTNPPKSKELNDKKLKKEKKQSRLDTDFENLEKIGQGGFGVVLKKKQKNEFQTFT